MEMAGREHTSPFHQRDTQNGHLRRLGGERKMSAAAARSGSHRGRCFVKGGGSRAGWRALDLWSPLPPPPPQASLASTSKACRLRGGCGAAGRGPADSDITGNPSKHPALTFLRGLQFYLLVCLIGIPSSVHNVKTVPLGLRTKTF